jgi:ribosome-associated protein
MSEKYVNIQGEESLRITETVSVPIKELTFSFARSRGAGGQHVNKVNTKVILSFDLAASKSLTEQDKEKISVKLATRISKNGILQVVSSAHRSQFANRQEAVRQFSRLLKSALARRKKRLKTKIPKVSREKRISLKKQRSEVKKLRSRKTSGNE